MKYAIKFEWLEEPKESFIFMPVANGDRGIELKTNPRRVSSLLRQGLKLSSLLVAVAVGNRSSSRGRGFAVADGGRRVRSRAILCLQLPPRTSQIFCKNMGLHLKQLERKTTVSLRPLVSAVYAGC